MTKKSKQSDEELEELWRKWNRIRELASDGWELESADEGCGDKYANAIVGGVAVFLWHREWSTLDAFRWPEIETAFRGVLNAPPASGGFYSEDSTATWTWDCFGAEAGAMLWAADLRNEEWRRVVGEAVFNPRYAALRCLFATCAEHRTSLGEDFTRLRRLALEWAFVRDRIDAIRRRSRGFLQLGERVLDGVRQELDDWANERLAAFIAGESEGFPSDWNRCDEHDRFRDLDAIRRPWPGYPGMNFRVVRCSHEWLPLPDEALDSGEREEVVRFWCTAIGFVRTRPLADLNRRDHQYPQEDERWVLERAAAALLQFRAEEQPELLWQAVFELHSEGHDWPEAFLQSLHQHALAAERTPVNFGPLVRLMLHFAFTEVDGKRRWSEYERVWDAIVGIDWYTCDLWEARHAVAVRELEDVFSLWMAEVPLNGRRLRTFAKWLRGPSAAPIRLRTLKWILGYVRGEDLRRPRDVREADDAIAALLNVVWDEEERAMRANTEAFMAFQGLLAWLGDRQNRLGLELLGRIGSLG
ncbi:MAG: hypothetical protein IPH48_16510 [bacterium]|nr:hypothetical protein [bacterium]